MSIILPDNGKFYKYRSCKNIDFIEEIISENKIWAASPLDFNDPFDCIPFMDAGKNNRDFIKWAKQAIDKRLPRPERCLFFKEIKKKMNKSPNHLIDCWRTLMGEYGVVSFASEFDNLLMWSHYADDHKGVCIEFSLADVREIEGLGVVGAVEYNQDRPTMSLFSEIVLQIISSDDNSEHLYSLLKQALFTKYEGWAYEKEWRWIKRIDNGNRHIILPQGCISRIIMGVSSSQQDKTKIRDLIKANKLAIPVVDTVFDGQRYGIRVK